MNPTIQINQIDPFLLGEFVKHQEDFKKYLSSGLFTEDGAWEICRRNGKLQDIDIIRKKVYRREKC